MMADSDSVEQRLPPPAEASSNPASAMTSGLEDAPAAQGTPQNDAAPLLPGPSWLSAIGWVLLYFLGQMSVAIVIAIVMGVALRLSGAEKEEVIKEVTRWSTASATFGAFLTAWVLTWFRYGSDTARVLGLRRPDFLHALLVALFVSPVWVVGSGLGSLVAHLLPVQSDVQGEAVQYLATTGWLSIVVAGSFFPGVGEEIFFRGFVGRGFVARYGVVGGVLLTSLVFGLFHFTPSQIAGTFVIGLGFHTVFLATKALPAAMLMHFLTNLQGLTLLARQPADADPQRAEFSGFSPYLVLLAIPTAALLGLTFYRLRTRWQFTVENPCSMPYVSGETPPVPALAVRDSLAQHWRLLALTLILWCCFSIGFIRSGAMGW